MLTERAILDPTVILVDSRQAAEMIIYPAVDHSDPRDGDLLLDFRPRELARTFVYSQADDPIPWAPGVYASIPAGRAGPSFAGGFYVAHHHREPGGIGADLEAAREIRPDLLWSFVGTASNHPVRERLAEIDDPRALVRDTQKWSDTTRWGWQSEHRTDGRSAFSDFAQVLGRSSFVVCPRGRGASSIRLFEALQAGRCPVIVSDDWVPPPFVDWPSCSLRVREREIGDLPALLRAREADAPALGRRARAAWEAYFSPERQLQTLVDCCREIAAASDARPALAARALLHPTSLRQGLRHVKQRVAR
jgi:hypothetical protein